MNVDLPSPPPRPDSVQRFLAELLVEQARLDTPVARFADAHENGSLARLALDAQLIPLTAPGPGEQYAFEVDLDSCTGCKSCVAACHSLNGLDETETWRDVGLLVSPSRARPFTQTVTSACHHCADPACLNGCPVLAYEKDPLTGIVHHLDDQCIGCSYCILKCPYDAPKFSARLGIVRKCDMCHARLAAGEAPACAQACPTHAIRIVTVPNENRKPETGDRKLLMSHPHSGDTSSYSESAYAIDTTTNPASRHPSPVSALRSPVSGFRSPVSNLRSPISNFLPAAPDPAYTLPTTRYVSRRAIPDHLIAADASTLRVQPAHTPLAIMLTLLPAAIGLQLSAESVTYYVTLSCWVLGAVGLAASVLHLGQPLRAWRIFLGWRRSWLTREALLFGAWFTATSAALLATIIGSKSVTYYVTLFSAGLGVAGLGCSAMIYVDTRRDFWRAAQTFPRFFGTALLFGVAFRFPFAATMLLFVKLAWETRTQFHGGIPARLQRGPLAPLVLARDALGISAAVLFGIAPPLAALVPLLLGEFAERLLFFRAVDAPKMPGMPAA